MDKDIRHKRLLIITDMFPSADNPVNGIFVKHQVDALAQQYRIMVIATSLYGSYKHSLVKGESYDIHYVTIPVWKRLFLSSIPSAYFHLLPVVKEVITSWQPSLIHVHDCRHVPELYTLKSLLDRIALPKYLTVHNIRTHPSRITTPYLSAIYRYCMKKAYSHWTHIFTVNERLKQQLLPYASAKDITMLGNAVAPIPSVSAQETEAVKLSLRQEAYKIISVGNLKKEKGFHLLIEAVSILLKKGYDLQCVIIGSGEYQAALQERLTSLHLDKNNAVILHSQLPNPLIRNLYRQFNAFVLPSYSETFGIVYLEAMDAGLPVIGVKGEGISAVIEEGRQGLLSLPQNAQDVAAKIEWLILNPDAAATMAAAGQELVQTAYRMEPLIGRITEVYEKA